MAPLTMYISGIAGRMGRLVHGLAAADPEFSSIHGFDALNVISPAIPNCDVLPPGTMDDTFERAEMVNQSPDVLLILINCAEAAVAQAKIAARDGIKVVIGTTGFSEKQMAELKGLGERTAILVASNFSLGVNVMAKQVEQLAKALPDYDVEIIEEHHSRKLDSPSGTALLLGEAVMKGRGEVHDYVLGRVGRAQQVRQPYVIGIHAVRAGGIAGNHEVIFAGPQEVIRLKHEAGTPLNFALGALKAVKFIAAQTEPGWSR